MRSPLPALKRCGGLVMVAAILIIAMPVFSQTNAPALDSVPEEPDPMTTPLTESSLPLSQPQAILPSVKQLELDLKSRGDFDLVSNQNNFNGAHAMRGNASFYGKEFAGKKTANGERFDPSAMTMAHRTLPFGEWVRVTNQHNKKSVLVRVNDRGPFAKGRVADLSKAAASQLGITHRGVAPVHMIKVVER
jgi:rare lipoprotein A